MTVGGTVIICVIHKAGVTIYISMIGNVIKQYFPNSTYDSVFVP